MCVCVCVVTTMLSCFCKDYREGGIAVGPDSKVPCALRQVRVMASNYMKLSCASIERAVMATSDDLLADSV